MGEELQGAVFPAEALVLVVVVADPVDDVVDGDGVAGLQNARKIQLVAARGRLEKEVERLGIAAGVLEQEPVAMQQGGIVARRGAKGFRLRQEIGGWQGVGQLGLPAAHSVEEGGERVVGGGIGKAAGGMGFPQLTGQGSCGLAGEFLLGDACGVVRRQFPDRLAGSAAGGKSQIGSGLGRDVLRGRPMAASDKNESAKDDRETSGDRHASTSETRHSTRASICQRGGLADRPTRTSFNHGLESGMVDG